MEKGEEILILGEGILLEVGVEVGVKVEVRVKVGIKMEIEIEIKIETEIDIEIWEVEVGPIVERNIMKEKRKVMIEIGMKMMIIGDMRKKWKI